MYAPFAVDSHLCICRESQIVDLGDVSNLLHVGSVATGTEDDTGFRRTVDVGRGDESTGRVVDERDETDGNVLSAASMEGIRISIRPREHEIRSRRGLTNLSRDCWNMAAQSLPSAPGAPKPFVHLIKTP